MIWDHLQRQERSEIWTAYTQAMRKIPLKISTPMKISTENLPRKSPPKICNSTDKLHNRQFGTYHERENRGNIQFIKQVTECTQLHKSDTMNGKDNENASYVNYTSMTGSNNKIDLRKGS